MSTQDIFLWQYLTSFGLIVLMKIVVFILGYLTIRLGYNLIVSGVKGEFKFSANLGGAKADLVSVSPGLLFVLLGVFLIGYAMYVEKGVKGEYDPISGSPSSRAVPQVPIPQQSPLGSIEERKKEPGQAGGIVSEGEGHSEKLNRPIPKSPFEDAKEGEKNEDEKD